MSRKRYRNTAALATSLLLALFICAPAHAQSVEADLGTHNVDVKVDFAGTNVLLFGSLFYEDFESDGPTPDVIIAVHGPERKMRVRRKTRIAGIWVNSESSVFDTVPGYYALVTNRSVEAIASSYDLHHNGIGFNDLQSKLLLSSAGFASASPREYAAALVRILKKDGLYQEHAGGVKFPGKHLFRAEFALPANVPLGMYTANIFIFQNGKLADEFTTTLQIEKRGIERFIFALAHENPFLYGILSVILAVMAGLGAAAIFRKK
jgi:uncharacterized protein (TIGR02186 family)